MAKGQKIIPGAGAADTAQNLHPADDTVQKVANTVTQSVQNVVRNVLPKRIPKLPTEDVVGLVKDTANNTLEALKPAANVMQNVAHNLTKSAGNSSFIQKMAHNLTQNAVDRTKFL